MLDPITEEFGWSKTTFTYATSFGTIIAGIVAIFIGSALDKYGGRWILTTSVFILGLSFILLAIVENYMQFFVILIINRIMTMGIIALATQVIVSKWFIVKRARAIAYSGLGIMLGNSITPLYVAFVADVYDWRMALTISGIVVFVVSLFPVMILIRKEPEDMGLLPDGELNPKDKILESTPPPKEEVSFNRKQVLKQPNFYLLVVAFSLLFVVGPGLCFHLISYLDTQGIERNQGAIVMSIWSFSGAIGAFFSGFMAEKFGTRKTIVATFLINSLTIFLILLINNFYIAIIWGIAQGILSAGLFNTLYQLIFAEYYGRNSLGSIRGMIWPVQMTTNASGPLFGSIIFDQTQSYDYMWIVFGFLMLISAIVTYFAKPPNVQ
ncbi:MAG: MFS transporter [Dehalococcoidia bacterium]